MRGRGGDSRNPRLEREAERWRERRLTEGFSLGEAFNQLPSRETGETGRLRFSIRIKCAAVSLVQKHSIFCHIFCITLYVFERRDFLLCVGRAASKEKKIPHPSFPTQNAKREIPTHSNKSNLVFKFMREIGKNETSISIVDQS